MAVETGSYSIPTWGTVGYIKHSAAATQRAGLPVVETAGLSTGSRRSRQEPRRQRGVYSSDGGADLLAPPWPRSLPLPLCNLLLTLARQTFHPSPADESLRQPAVDIERQPDKRRTARLRPVDVSVKPLDGTSFSSSRAGRGPVRHRSIVIRPRVMAGRPVHSDFRYPQTSGTLRLPVASDFRYLRTSPSDFRHLQTSPSDFRYLQTSGTLRLPVPSDFRYFQTSPSDFRYPQTSGTFRLPVPSYFRCLQTSPSDFWCLQPSPSGFRCL